MPVKQMVVKNTDSRKTAGVASSSSFTDSSLTVSFTVDRICSFQVEESDVRCSSDSGYISHKVKKKTKSKMISFTVQQEERRACKAGCNEFSVSLSACFLCSTTVVVYRTAIHTVRYVSADRLCQKKHKHKLKGWQESQRLAIVETRVGVALNLLEHAFQRGTRHPNHGHCGEVFA